MNIDVSRRASEPEDRDALFALRAASLRPLIDDWRHDDERAAFAAGYVAGAHVVVVAPPTDAIVGMFRVERRRIEILVAELYVDERVRRRGIATRILRELIDEALRSDVAVSIHVPPRAAPAIALLKKLGFVVVPSKERGRSRFVWRVA